MAEGRDLEHTLGNLPTGAGGASQQAELQPGARVAGRYRIERTLGRGGSGVVYQAHDERLSRRVALKALHGEDAGGESARAQLLQEARTIAGLSHPSIVTLHELVVEESGCFTVSELMDGGSLVDRVREGGLLEEEELLTLARTIGEGLTLAHARGVLHRDVKPGNVLFSATGHAKLGDFGLATAGAGPDALSLEGRGAGTLLYAAPEQLRDASAATVASDLFSLAATLYYAATGEAPHAIRLDRVPACIRAALERALEADPARRPRSVEELLDLLVESAPTARATLRPPGRESAGPGLVVGDRTYHVEGLLAHGDSSAVYRARWAGPPGELVVIKVLRAGEDADLLRREWQILTLLQRSRAQGSGHFAGLLPEPIALGETLAGGERRLAAVYRWRSGFLHTIEDVLEAHPDGVAGPIVLWVFKRVLELLAFAHHSGVVHGAVLPPHVLVHPRDHGATLVGWSVATRWTPAGGERLPAYPRAWSDLYPAEVLRHRRVSPATDVTMAARCMQQLARGRDAVERAGSPLRQPVADLVAAAAAGEHADAWELRELLSAASRQAYGPPRYNPLPMPGWPAHRDT